MKDNNQHYYTGPERRLARTPRRTTLCRRHRLRTESLVSDCRQRHCRREEDEDGFIELSSLYETDELDILRPDA